METEKSKSWLWPVIIVVIVIVLVAVLAIWNWQKNKIVNKGTVKIGVITDLSGPVSVWGQSSKVGAELAKQDLEKSGYKVDLIFEDYQMDPAKALTSAQKLVNTDGVNAIYAEFNPATYSITPFLKDKNIPWIYDAAPISPLVDSPYAYKSYLDFTKGCEQMAQKFKDQGVTKLGVLELNWEAGKLCSAGIQKVYSGSNLTTETYDFGALDLKTQVTKLKEAGVGAIINAALEPDTLTTFKAMQDLNFSVPFGTVVDGATPTVQTKYPDQYKKTLIFGFGDIEPSFSARVTTANPNLVTQYGAALAYVHVNQLVKAVGGCQAADMICVKNKLDASPADNTVGFKGYINRVANFITTVK